jgi:ATP-dependent Clp protease ATP-binding subunit ClpA
VAQVQIDLRRVSADQQELRGPLTMNGYNFTERVRKVLAMAREESARLHHEYVGTEHILLGLIREGEGVAATILQNLDADLDELEGVIEGIVKKGSPRNPTGPDLPYTSRAKKVLELAMAEAREANHTYVGSEHLLLGLIAEQKGIAAQVLADFGVDMTKARAEMFRILGTEMKLETPAPTREGIRRPKDSIVGMRTPVLADRVREVLADAETIATKCRSADLLPIHVAVALLQYGEGMAIAVLDRLGCDRVALQLALEDVAKAGAPALVPEGPVTFGQVMVVFQRHSETQLRWRTSPPGTLQLLLALLDTQPELATIFEAHGVNADKIRAEERRISG